MVRKQQPDAPIRCRRSFSVKGENSIVPQKGNIVWQRFGVGFFVCLVSGFLFFFKLQGLSGNIKMSKVRRLWLVRQWV